MNADEEDMGLQGVEGIHCRAGTVAAQFLVFFHEYLRISALSAVIMP